MHRVEIARDIYERILEGERNGKPINFIYMNLATQAILAEDITYGQMIGDEATTKYAKEIFKKTCIIENSIPTLITLVSHERLTKK